MLQILHDNWPQLLLEFKINGLTPGHQLIDSDTREYIYRNLSLVIQMSDKTIYIPPGLGITMGGYSVKIIMEINNLNYSVCKITELYLKEIMSGSEFNEAKTKILESV